MRSYSVSATTRFLVIPLALFACLALATSSAGSMSTTRVRAQLEFFPYAIHARQRVTVQLRPFRVISGRKRPLVIAAEHRWRVTASHLGGLTRSLRLVRAADDPYVWTASLRPPSTGSWRFRVEGDRADAALKVHVLPRGPVGTMATLQRPFHTPTIPPGVACPTSPQSGDLSRLGYNGLAWGSGPAFPGFFEPLSGKPGFLYTDPISRESINYGSRWSGQKVLWIVDRQIYQGPILIRGRQVDGLNRLRFGDGRVPADTMTIPAAAKDRPSRTRIHVGAAGCYAYQVDGTSFSSVIVFETRVAGSPRAR